MTQSTHINVLNNFQDQIDIDWEVEFVDNAEDLLTISVYDISLDYTPATHTSCDINSVSNILDSSVSYQMGLHTILSGLPSSFDQSKTLAYFNLYRRGDCTGEQLLHLPIHADVTLSNVEDNISQVSQTLTISPNPAVNYIQVDSDIDHPITYEIYDIHSRQVMNGNTLNGQIDVTQLTSGDYFIIHTPISPNRLNHSTNTL